jgi:hypothetical protein
MRPYARSVESFVMIAGFDTAIHECGHSVTALATGLPLVKVSLDPALMPSKWIGGAVFCVPKKYTCNLLSSFSDVTVEQLRGELLLPLLDGHIIFETTLTLLYARAIMAMGGREAELLVFGENRTQGEHIDLKIAKHYARFATGDTEAFLRLARADAKKIILSMKKQVENLATALLEFVTLDADQIRDLVSGAATVATMRERARRKVWRGAVVRAAAFEGRVEQQRV